MGDVSRRLELLRQASHVCPDDNPLRNDRAIFTFGSLRRLGWRRSFRRSGVGERPEFISCRKIESARGLTHSAHHTRLRMDI